MTDLMDFQQPGYMAAPPKKKSIMDNVLAAIYPAGSFGEMLPPDVLNNERHMALRHAGLSLLGAGGPRPQGTRNVGADFATAFDPSGWDQRLASVAQTGMQLHGMQKKLQDEETAQRILEQFKFHPSTDEPTEGDETPAHTAARYKGMASAFQTANLPEHAQVSMHLHDEFKPGKVETTLHAMPDGTTQLLNTANGDVIKTWGAGQKPNLTPSEIASNTLAYRRQFETEISGAETALKAYKAYTGTQAKGAVADPIRLANALKILVPSAGISVEQILSGNAAGGDYAMLGPVGALLKAFDEKGNLGPAGRATLNAMVEAQIGNIRATAKQIVRHHRAMGSAVGLDPDTYIYDPTEDESSFAPAPKGTKDGADRVQQAADSGRVH